jgi:hypothetical protein
MRKRNQGMQTGLPLRPVRLQQLLLRLLLAGATALPLPTHARSFHAEGSDTGAGLGPRWVAQGGAGVASAGDVFAATFNPAGLVAVQGVEMSLARQAGDPLQPVNAAALAWRLPAAWSAAVGAEAATLALLHYPRVHATATGRFASSDFESLFLRYLLPGINGDFDGSITSKTKATRLALGLAPAGSAWLLGLYVERIDCRSDFCGVHATSNGYTVSSTGAVATGVGLGLRWQAAPDWTWGLALSDLRTRLAIDSVTTDAAGTRRSVQDARFPRKWALGLAHDWHGGGWGRWRLALDAERMQGAYGRSTIDLQLVRAGAERSVGPWAWRVGALVPLKVASSESGELKPPFPFSPTAGVGYRRGALGLDIAVYAHTVMSMHRDRVVPAADVGLSWRH